MANLKKKKPQVNKKPVSNGVTVTGDKSKVNNNVNAATKKKSSNTALKEKEQAKKIAIAKRQDELTIRRNNAMVDRDKKRIEKEQAIRKAQGRNYIAKDGTIVRYKSNN